MADRAEHDAAIPAVTHDACLNCGVPLHGRYCHACGQSTDDRHRSILHLGWEAVEGLTHLDGRLGRTLPALLLRPGLLSRDYIEGRHQRHIPPFRLFLVSLLLFMLAAEWSVGRDSRGVVRVEHDPAGQVHLHTQAGPAEKPEDTINFGDSKDDTKVEAWFRAHGERAVQNKEYFLSLVFEWAHRLAVLLLPMLAACFTAAYFYRKNLFIHDHLLVSMQYLAFCFLLWGSVNVLPGGLRDTAFFPALAWTNFNLYQILRVAYGSSRKGAAMKALLIWLATVTAFGILVAGLLAIALDEV